jgi:hypothetical protein
MSNEVVRQFFDNYLLIRNQGFDVFTREQSKLFPPDLVTIASDTRGTLTYQGIYRPHRAAKRKIKRSGRL